MSWDRGKSGFFVGLAVIFLGICTGLIRGKAPFKKFVFAPILSLPVYLLGELCWWPIESILHGARLWIVEPLGAAFLFLFSAFAGRVVAVPSPTHTHKRGTLLDDAPNPVSSGAASSKGLTLAGQSVPPGDETKHFKVIGTTGTGKSTAIRELLTAALARGDRAVIADPDGSYVGRFYDVRRGDLILNPFDDRAARWDLFAELLVLQDADQLAQSLIPDGEGNERSWRAYARVFLTALLRQLHRVQIHDVGELFRLVSAAPAEELQDLLADTPAGPYLSQDNGRFFGAVRAVANTYLVALEHVARQSAAPPLSVRRWVSRKRGEGRGVLFLPYRANEIATVRSLISTWMRIAIFETLSQGEGDQRLWFVVDELDALGQIDGLKDALARLRKFGGRCVLGFQSIAQVSGIYGRSEAQTIVENCANTLILRCSTSEGGGTARFASALIGEREIVRAQISRSYRPGEMWPTKTVGEQRVTESAVLTSEIEQLPDLQGYLKFASTTNWRRAHLRVD